MVLEGFMTDIPVSKPLKKSTGTFGPAAPPFSGENFERASAHVQLLQENSKGSRLSATVESCFKKHSDILFSHGIVLHCLKKFCSEIYEAIQ